MTIEKNIQTSPFYQFYALIAFIYIWIVQSILFYHHIPNAYPVLALTGASAIVLMVLYYNNEISFEYGLFLVLILIISIFAAVLTASTNFENGFHIKRLLNVPFVFEWKLPLQLRQFDSEFFLYYGVFVVCLTMAFLVFHYPLMSNKRLFTKKGHITLGIVFQSVLAVCFLCFLQAVFSAGDLSKDSLAVIFLICGGTTFCICGILRNMACWFIQEEKGL